MLNFIEEKKETRVTDIYRKLKLEQSLASSYLAMLRRAGVVKTRRDGQVIYYSVDHARLSEVTKGAKMVNG
jgi:DNA-binding transcriptional ArsR family regulator